MFRHDQSEKIGVLLTNLGTPEAPTTSALRVYLKEFLSDPRVVEVPRLIWWLILNLIILRFRPKRSAHAYSTVWTDKGSPLMLHTQAQTVKVREHLRALYGDDIVVEFAMRYGRPAVGDVLQKMQEQGVRKLIVLPLYPQYSGSTTGSTFDAIAADFAQRRWLPDLRFISHYHDHSPFISACANKIALYWNQHGRPDKLILSYHGIPKRYLLNGDPYHCECHKTSRLIAERLGLTESQYMTTFQSRFGREEWLKPYTDETLKGLPTQGIKRVDVFCPGFSSDCLETIEEIGVENRDYFLEAGGDEFHYIEALNSDDEHISALVALIEKNIQGWHLNTDLDHRAKLAIAMGADQ